MTGVLRKRRNLDRETLGRTHMSMKAEIEVMLLQVKEYKLLPESPEAM